MKKPLIVIFLVLLLDQFSKILVKTTMAIGEAIPVFGKWFYILFIENNGMAFGWEISGAEWGKLFLSLFRIAAVVFLFWLLFKLVKKNVKFGPLFGISLLIAGALGNIIDGMFYGLIFNASTDFYTSYFVPFGTGYAPFLMGKVVDMFYFPLIVTTWPDWVPYVGGNPYVFFSPIFNFADSSISVGVVLLLLFYRKEIGEITLKKKDEA